MGLRSGAVKGTKKKLKQEAALARFSGEGFKQVIVEATPQFGLSPGK